MKTPLWFPQSFFSRTLWLVLIVVLFSKALTLVYLLMNEDVLVDRQYSHGVALTLRAYWAADENDREAIAEAAGLIRVVGGGVPEGEQHWPYSEIYQRQMQGRAGCRYGSASACARTARALGQGAEPWGWLAESTALSAPVTRPENLECAGLVPGHRVALHGVGVDFCASIESARSSVWSLRLDSWGRGAAYACRSVDTPSEMTEVYRAFNQMAEDVEQAGQERELMLAGVSHDLRTPLTRLRLSLELMNDNEFSEGMVRDIEDMDAILDQFLAFIRDGRDEEIEEVDLGHLVRDVVAPFNNDEDSIRLCLEPIPPFPLRRVSMKRLLTNLIGNARHHAGNGIEVAAYVSGDRNAPS
ncbi:hypothetical protein GS393_00194 [Pseudomonas savastanoi pv. phaseolicola]|nr:hypothetical protein [Pseudomonas savastanoi pv. phaseolicola]